jgi:hypothetical protein
LSLVEGLLVVDAIIAVTVGVVEVVEVVEVFLRLLFTSFLIPPLEIYKIVFNTLLYCSNRG